MLHTSCRLLTRQAIVSSMDDASPISIPLGIAIGLFASFVQSLGLTIQRKSHVLNQLLPEDQQRVEHRRPLWLLGFVVFISSNLIGSLVQIASLPVVILAPLGAVSLLWNAFFARLLLDDVFSPWMVLGTILIAGGAVLIALFGIMREPTRSLEDLLELFGRPTFVIYFSILGAAMAVSIVLAHVTEYSYSRRLRQSVLTKTSTPSSTSSPTPTFLRSGHTNVDSSDENLSTEYTPLLNAKKPRFVLPSSHEDPVLNRTRLLLALSYSSFSGILSGMCLLFAKSGVELLVLTLRGHNQFWRWQAWLLVLSLVVFALLQLWYLHKALILAAPTLVCPSAFCFYNLSSIVNGLIYFDQFSLITPSHLALVVVGIVVLLGGVWIVSVQPGGAVSDGWSDAAGDVDEVILVTESTDGDQIEAQEVTYRDEEEILRGSMPTSRNIRSDTSVPVVSTSPGVEDIERQGVHDGHLSQRLHPRSATMPVDLAYASTRTPASMGRRGTLQKRRPTVEGSQPSTSQTTHRSPSSHHGGPSVVHGVPAPTFGAGIQIGLSPVSPGFSIVPRERGRRSSGLGLGVPSSYGGVLLDSTFHQDPSNQKRQTVSEGDLHGRVLDIEQEDEEVDQSIGNEPRSGRGSKGKSKEGGSKWRWLRQVFRHR